MNDYFVPGLIFGIVFGFLYGAGFGYAWSGVEDYDLLLAVAQGLS